MDQNIMNRLSQFYLSLRQFFAAEHRQKAVEASPPARALANHKQKAI